MDYVYAPWRSEYVDNKKTSNGCVFCDISQHKENDKDNYVFYRDDKCFIVINKYPYTPGHFMIIPHIHTNNIDTLDIEIWRHISLLTRASVKLLKNELDVEGVNLGMNIGEAGGAGIADHIHMHIVPRWHRDTNFITTICKTRIYPTDFYSICEKFKMISKNYFENSMFS